MYYTQRLSWQVRCKHGSVGAEDRGVGLQAHELLTEKLVDGLELGLLGLWAPEESLVF